MTLAAGSRVGVYEVVGPLGAGGMGEVYRAHDATLHRDVALKVLPAAFAADPERLARFKREAHVLASLNHPSIAAIYGFQASDSVQALVLELVDGPTLAERIARGPIPLRESLSIARQVAEALEAAHERGVIHRDLKPANIKLRGDGAVKVLDFGLAKALDPVSGSSAEISLSPTITSPAMTGAGLILGTAAYMSPEQAKGRVADKRSDVWSFGCVLYEMLTARRPFAGEDVADTLAFILTREPGWDALPADVPASIRKLLRRCLEKDRKNRLADIGDARLDIDEALAGLAGSQTAQTAAAPAARRGLASLPASRAAWALAGIAAGVLLTLAGLAVLSQPRTQPRPSVLRFAILPPDQTAFAPVPALLGLSPDGRRLAFVSGATRREQKLWVRPLDSLVAQPIPGTETAWHPLWSPDGRSIVFASDLVLLGRVRKVDLSGGPPLTLAEVGRAGAWSKDGVILLRGRDGRVYRVPDTGGEAVAVTELDGAQQETIHTPRLFLPDGRRFIFQAQNTGGSKGALHLASIDSPGRTLLLDGVMSSVAYANGQLVFQRDGTLMARPFDADAGRFTGSAVPILEALHFDPLSGSAAFSLSDTGVLAYRSFPWVGPSMLTWFSRQGQALFSLPVDGTFRSTRMPSLAPDAKHLAVTRSDGPGKSDVWVIDLVRNVPTRLTFDSASDTPIWSPDGKRLIYTSNRKGVGDLYERTLESTQDGLLYESPSSKQAHTISPDGKVLLFGQSPQGNPEIWALPMTGERTPVPIVKTGYPAGMSVFSPDGKWFAYCEGDSGPDQVYVQPYPPTGHRVRVSVESGSSPQWSADGKSIVYTTSDNHLVAVTLAPSGSTLSVGPPQELFLAPETFLHRSVLFDSTRARFLLPVSPEAPAVQPINVVVNWMPEIESRRNQTQQE